MAALNDAELIAHTCNEDYRVARVHTIANETSIHPAREGEAMYYITGDPPVVIWINEDRTRILRSIPYHAIEQIVWA